MGFVLKDRLKGLKVSIKGWSAEVYGKPDEKKKQLMEKILELDLRSGSTGISVVEVGVRKRLFDDLWLILKSIDASIFQRSRVKWMKEGDANTRYFHSCINARKRSNNLLALRTPHGWVEGPAAIREATTVFFKNHFDNVGWHRPVLVGGFTGIACGEQRASCSHFYQSGDRNGGYG
ncbi:RNA-directed DNA polymerase (Reverse transcriptase) [Trifolium medium]|uniref:RNA-directed DNA polymerase (Reverse transcriptase) n=1 Tax=Trifolium medium TaxID=97028 RepID=A0A392PJ80_9FABA|nr:RNA-directed DNA polymerase (Reverse transcriptase) [Trifolium medium]